MIQSPPKNRRWIWEWQSDTGTGKKDEKVIKKKNISLVVFGKIRNHEAVLKYARNMSENYKKRIVTRR